MSGKVSNRDRQIVASALEFASRSGKPMGEDLAQDVRSFLRSAAEPRVIGVSRDEENPQAIIVSFSSPLTDDQLRAFHDSLRARATP